MGRLDSDLIGIVPTETMQNIVQNMSTPQPRPARSRLHRWLMVAVGVLLVGVGAVGVFLPGLPTTVFLLGASWCFARSCPWLEDRLIRVPLFRPFLVYLDQGAQMPRKVVIWTLVVMWAAIAVSTIWVGMVSPPRPVFAVTIIALGVIGSVFVIRLGSRREGESPGRGLEELLPPDPVETPTGSESTTRRRY